MCCPGFPSHPSEEHWNAAQKRPPLVSAIVAMCKPKTAATALKLLKAYPNVTLDAELLEPLFAKDHERLKKLASDPSCTPFIK